MYPVNGVGLGEREYRRFFVEEKSNNHLLYFKLLHPYLSTCCNYYIHSLHAQCITCSNKLIFFSDYYIVFILLGPSTVSDVTLNRINGTHAIVTWSQLSLTESRGILQNYTIEYSIAADRGKRQVRTTTVPSNQSNVTLYDLTPSRSYEVSVFASTNAGPGTASQPEILDSKHNELVGLLIMFRYRANNFEISSTSQTKYDLQCKHR